MKRKYLRIGAIVAAGVAFSALLGGFALLCSYVYLAPSLPSAEAMRGVELQVPLRVYTRNGELIAQIGEQRRIPTTYEEIPQIVRQAFIAAEDDRFFEHDGVNYVAVMRAVLVNLTSGERAQGASTITMQAARNMFLTLDKTWSRKLQELFLTYRMEREFTKEQILSLYLNVIFFGQRAYGVAAAAETFFGKRLDELTVAEAATLAGIPQAPSLYNPIVGPEAAKARRSYVLRRMRELGFIDEQTAVAADREPLRARLSAPQSNVEAAYVAEMARLELRSRFGEAAETAGYKVYTTIDAHRQIAANRAMRAGLVEYDRRYGYRGPVRQVELPEAPDEARLDALLNEHPTVGHLQPALVVGVEEKAARVYVKSRGFAQIGWEGLSWARKPERPGVLGPAPARAQDVFSRGDVIYVVAEEGGGAQLAQVPEAQGALVALDPRDGAVVALVGGFDYFENKYNRVIQARRQPGSAFKPFLYSAALEAGFTPASVLLDAPVVLDGEDVELAWRPENSTRQFHGPTRLREALVRSRNLVSIRLLRALGIEYTIDYVTKFGFPRERLPSDLTLALGTLAATPLEMAAGYAVFANGGYRVEPYFIDRIESPTGEVVWKAEPRVVCEECDPEPEPLGESVMLTSTGDVVDAAAQAMATAQPAPNVLRKDLPPPERVAPRVISRQNAYLMTDMMEDVVRRGTGRRALELGRSDLAGKTGTTNDARDTWFNGFSPHLVATVWVGFDQERSLGENEEGGRTALPIWVDFMRVALEGLPDRRRPMPAGLITLHVSAETGTIVSADSPDAVLETFMIDRLPEGSLAEGTRSRRSTRPEPVASESLF